MRRYSRAELVAFLRGIDVLLDQPADLRIIGGAAAALRYGADQVTKDIDTWSDIPPAVLWAAERVRVATGLAIPMERASVLMRRTTMRTVSAKHRCVSGSCALSCLNGTIWC